MSLEPFLIAGLSTLVLVGLLIHDSALQRLHDESHAKWQRAGKPRGVFWQSEEGPPRDPFAHLWVAVSLVYRDPAWVRDEASLRGRMHVARVLIAVGGLGAAVVVASL